MQKITFTKEQVSVAYDELCRRLSLEYTEELANETATEGTYEEQCYFLRHGLYSVFSSLAANWPEVRDWCDQEEDARGLWAEE